MLTKSDCQFILESLEYTKRAFENYKYPTYEMKRDRIDDCYQVILRVRELRDSTKEIGNDSMD